MILRLLIAWLCNLLDIAATLYFYIVHDGVELNPISAELLQSPSLFAAFKLVTVTIAVMFVWWKRDWKLCKAASWVLLVEYLLVAIYYVRLIVLIAI